MHASLPARHFKAAIALVCFLLFSIALYHGYYVSARRPWLRLPRLQQYYNGLITLIPSPPLEPGIQQPQSSWSSANAEYPTPQPYAPYSSLHHVKPCYLDAQNKVEAPSMYAYHGVPYAMPSPTLGSYQLFGFQDKVCFDRFARYGPYGLGYGQDLGGIGLGNKTESIDNDAIWAKTGKINYTHVDWADAQQRCYASNQQRFHKSRSKSAANRKESGTQPRTAMVVRCYEGFKWTPMVIVSFRAMITELSLKTGGEYDVHLLMQVRDVKYPQWLDESRRKRYIAKHVPREFGRLVTLWSESQMKLMYPGNFGRPFKNPSRKDMHGVFRSPHLALQTFAKEHPEYEFLWNWEMDVRVVGNFYELLNGMSNWAATRCRRLLWEHNERYFIPSYHQSWANFSSMLSKNEAVSNESVFGPVQASWRKPLRHEKRGGSLLPDGCLQHADTCGDKEAADLITLSPIFDTRNSGWWFRNDVTGYDKDLQETLPRRASIVTVARLSRRLLLAMDEEVYHSRHNLFAEMFPATVAYHHGFKAVYAPHPVYLDRAWDAPAELDRFFNSGERHSTSGKGGPFSPGRERVNKISSWYFSSRLPAELWRRWLGYHGGGGVQEGGATGRMCLRSMLLHPIKHEDPME